VYCALGILVIGVPPVTGAGKKPVLIFRTSTVNAVAGKIAVTVIVPVVALPTGEPLVTLVAPETVKGPGDAGQLH
jgi:hypothetical protein